MTKETKDLSFQKENKLFFNKEEMYSFQQANNNPDLQNKSTSIDEEVPLKNDPHQSPYGKPSLSPFLVNTLEGSNFVYASYCPRYNMIIAGFYDCTIKFYDATTLMPIEGRKVQKLNGYVTFMSYDDETETFLIGSNSGSIYAYNASSEELKKLQRCEYVQTIAFVNSRFYVFGEDSSRDLAIGSLDNENISRVYSGNSDCKALEFLSKRDVLISGSENGFLRIYRTDKPPHFKDLSSIKAFPAKGKGVLAIKTIHVNGKEYILASGRDCTVKVWHLVKGKMRLLRVIQTEGIVNFFAYLENYKVIATVSHRSNTIEFWNVLTWKLEKTFVCDKISGLWNSFLIEHKNVIGTIGGSGSRYDSIEFIQLG